MRFSQSLKVLPFSSGVWPAGEQVSVDVLEELPGLLHGGHVDALWGEVHQVEEALVLALGPDQDPGGADHEAVSRATKHRGGFCHVSAGHHLDSGDPGFARAPFVGPWPDLVPDVLESDVVVQQPGAQLLELHVGSLLPRVAVVAPLEEVHGGPRLHLLVVLHDEVEVCAVLLAQHAPGPVQDLRAALQPRQDPALAGLPALFYQEDVMSLARKVVELLGLERLVAHRHHPGYPAAWTAAGIVQLAQIASAARASSVLGQPHPHVVGFRVWLSRQEAPPRLMQTSMLCWQSVSVRVIPFWQTESGRAAGLQPCLRLLLSSSAQVAAVQFVRGRRPS